VLADAGIAPQLLHCGLLDGKNNVRNTGIHVKGCAKLGGLYVVPIRISWNTSKERLRRSPPGYRMSVKRLSLLFSGDNVLPIDLDWARRVNEARYPRNVLRSVKWPRKTEELKMIPKPSGHDWFVLDQLFPK